MEGEPVLVSSLEHWSFCPRQCALIHLEQIFEENVFTVRGQQVHERVDEGGWQHADAARVERGLPIWSERLGLVGKADVVEFGTDGTPYPVEYKFGRRRRHPHAAIQLCAQALCLEEMTGKTVPIGAIFHFSSRRRQEVRLDDELRKATEETIVAVHGLLATGEVPVPVADTRCRDCSLRDVCLPEARKAAPRQLEALYEVEG